MAKKIKLLDRQGVQLLPITRSQFVQVTNSTALTTALGNNDAVRELLGTGSTFDWANATVQDVLEVIAKYSDSNIDAIKTVLENFVQTTSAQQNAVKNYIDAQDTAYLALAYAETASKIQALGTVTVDNGYLINTIGVNASGNLTYTAHQITTDEITYSYTEGSNVRTESVTAALSDLFHRTVNSSTALGDEIDTIESAVGLGDNGNYTSIQSGAATGTTVKDDLTYLNTKIDDAVTGYVAAINALDLDAVTDGKHAIISVSQENGYVHASYGNIDASYVDFENQAGAWTANAPATVEAAISELKSSITGATVSEGNAAIDVNPTSSGTAISLVVDSNDSVLSIDGTNGLKSAISIAACTAAEVNALGANVKEAYKLVGKDGSTKLGTEIKIYKDSSLIEVWLGTSTDSVNASDGTITKTAIANGQVGDSLNYVYLDANGTYQIVKIPVGKFLQESEFGNGLQVVDGNVSVKKDTTSGKVTISDGNGGSSEVDVLTVGANGIKVDNIQAAISYAVTNNASDLNASLSDNDDNSYVTVGINQTNGKIGNLVVTTANIASASNLTAEVSARNTNDAAIASATGIEYSNGSYVYGTPVMSGQTNLKGDVSALKNYVGTLPANESDVLTYTFNAINEANSSYAAQDESIRSAVGLSTSYAWTHQIDGNTTNTVVADMAYANTLFGITTFYSVQGNDTYADTTI